MYMNDEASCILSIAYVFKISRKSMATIVMDEKRAIEVNINIPDNSNKMFEKQFDSFLTYIDVLFVFIADVGKI